MKILKFNLPTCRPCITLSEQMKELDLSNFEIQEISLRADKESKELGDRYNIRSVPTLVILDEQGNEVERVRNIAQLKSFLNKGVLLIFEETTEKIKTEKTLNDDTKILVVDINYLPSVFKDKPLEDIREQLEQMYSCKVLLLDASRQNIHGSSQILPAYFI